MDVFLTFEGLSSLLFGFLCIGFAAYRSALNGKLSYLEWVLLFCGLIYGLAAPLVVAAILESPMAFVGSEFIVGQRGAFGLHTISGIFGVVGVACGWGIAFAVTSRRHSRVGVGGSAGDSVALSSAGSLRNIRDSGTFLKAFWLMLGLGVGAQILYSLDYGGLLGVFETSRLLRSGLLLEDQRSRFSFLSPLAGFSLIACYGFFGILVGKVPGRSVGARLGFAISFVFSLYVLFSWVGRLGLVAFFAIWF